MWEWPTDSEQRANADLFAAAPELLKACELVDEWHDLVKQNYTEMLRPFIAARAAIAKAKGTS